MKEKVIILLLAILTTSISNSFAQGVAINSDGSNADGSAMLDVKSTNAGMLIPRMTQDQRNSLSSPATSLIIFQTDNTPGYYYNSGTTGSPVWERLVTGDNLGFVDGSGVATRLAFWTGETTLGSNANLYWDNSNGRLGIGTTSPTQKLEVAGNVKANNFYTGFNWTEKSKGINLGVDGITGGIGFYNGSTTSSASIFREVTSSNFYVGVRSGHINKGITINTDGDVGIGTTTPLAQLHTTGTVRFQNYTNGFLQVDANGNLSIGTGSTLFTAGNGLTWSGTTLNSLWTASGNNIYNNNTGNLGIGCNTPIAKMQIDICSGAIADNSTMDKYNSLFFQTGISSGEGAGIAFTIFNSGTASQYSSVTPGGAIVFERTGSNSKGKLHFKVKTSTTGGAALTKAITISDDANVGIGTTTPAYKLDVNGSLKATDYYSGDGTKGTESASVNISYVNASYGYNNNTFQWEWTINDIDQTTLNFKDGLYVGASSKSVSSTDLTLNNEQRNAAISNASNIKHICDFGSEIVSENEVWIEFEGNFKNQLKDKVPVINITSTCGNIVFYISEKNSNGFRVKCESTLNTLSFDWMANAKVERELKRIDFNR